MPELGVSGALVRLVRSPWDTELAELLSVTKHDLLLACPFITRSTARWISGQLSKTSRVHALRIVCLTNIRPESVLAGSLELDGLAEMGSKFINFGLFHVPSLHAKVYIADATFAIITSGNLTEGGLKGNCEYGVALRDPGLVGEIRRDFEGYSRLGASISIDEASGLADDLLQLQALYKTSEHQVLKEAGSVFRKKLRAAQDTVLRFRARGKSTHAIFCETIEYLLSKGPLRTVDMHPLVQRMHPDICDDDIDRMIDGVNFGKKWKHHVRTAQQALKRAHQISFDGKKWHLTDQS